MVELNIQYILILIYVVVPSEVRLVNLQYIALKSKWSVNLAQCQVLLFLI